MVNLRGSSLMHSITSYRNVFHDLSFFLKELLPSLLHLIVIKIGFSNIDK
jgi:hypothetical protein